jgi:predicted esterase
MSASQPSSPPPATALERWRSSANRPIVFLHGFDGHPDSYDLEQLTDELGCRSVVRAIGPVSMADGFTWWVAEDGADPTPEARSTALDALFEQLPQTHEPIVLIGFSQGAAAAVGAALRPTNAKSPIAAVVAVAGFLAFPVDEAVVAAPMFFVHPSDDSVVDIFLAEQATRLLKRAGFDATLQEVDGDHEWSSLVVAPVVNFLLRH